MSRKKALKSYTVAELFCGCGGFSHGFSRTGWFQTVFGNDVKKLALKTFKKNHIRSGNVIAAIQVSYSF